MDWTLFENPIQLDFYTQIWLILPLCAAVAIVYKTIRTENLRRLPVEIATAFGYMLAGLVVLGAALWALQRYWA